MCQWITKIYWFIIYVPLNSKKSIDLCSWDCWTAYFVFATSATQGVYILMKLFCFKYPYRVDNNLASDVKKKLFLLNSKVKGHIQWTVHMNIVDVQYLYSMIMKATTLKCMSHLQKIQIFRISKPLVNSQEELCKYISLLGLLWVHECLANKSWQSGKDVDNKRLRA